jgi:hypothetical protein
MITNDTARKFIEENRNLRIRTILAFSFMLVGILFFILRLGALEATSYDYQQDYQAAIHLIHGESIYSDDRAINNHPPFAAILITPLTLLNYPAAIFCWSVLSLILYLGIGLLILNGLQINLPKWGFPLLVGAALAWYPFLEHIALGQLSLLLIFCILFGWFFLRRDNDIFAGVFLGLACLIKLFPGLFFVYLALRGRWKAFLAAVFTLLIGMICSYIIVGGQDFLHYFLDIAPLDARLYLTFPVNVSLFGAIGRIFTPGPWMLVPLLDAPEIGRFVTLGACLILVLWLTWKMWKLPAARAIDDYLFAITTVVMLLVSPITWNHVYPVLALPFGLILQYALERKSKRAGILLICTLGLLSLPEVEIAVMLLGITKNAGIQQFASIGLLYPTLGLLLLAWLLIKGLHGVLSIYPGKQD